LKESRVDFMDENIIRRIQPHNNDAEKSVIGAMLMDRDVISDVADLLSREDFYDFFQLKNSKLPLQILS